MQAKDLTEEERQVLFALLAHLSVADRGITAGEFAEIDALGEEIGIPALHEALGAARAAHPTQKDALEAARGVVRSDAREMIRTLLHDLATSDGERSSPEEALLHDLAAIWPRE